MDKIKILWIGDAVATTGFATVSHNILENLPKRTYEIHQLGVNYYGDPHDYSYKIYPAFNQGEVYGLRRLAKLVRMINPDIIFILNDAWIIDAYLNEIRENNIETPIAVYFPIDAKEHTQRWYKHFDLVKAVCVYTNFAKNVVLATGAEHVQEDKIHVIPHGIDTTQFYPVDNNVARASIYPLDRRHEFMNSFVVLNANRNQPRKRIDITSWAFRDFAKGKDDVRIYMHMGTTDSGIDIIETAVRYGYSEKLVITANTASLPSVPVDRLNLIYNGTDIGINTSEGEGWGLTNWEHAATGKLQMVPNSSAPAEIWKPGTAVFLETEGHTMFPNINTVGDTVKVSSVVEKLEWAYEDWKTNDSKEINEIARAGYDLVLNSPSWKDVANEFNKVIRGVIG